MFNRKIVLFLSLVVLLAGVSYSSGLAPRAHAQSVASCVISRTVNNSTGYVTINGSVSNNFAGLDFNTAYISLSDSDGGGEDKSVNQTNVSESYTKFFENGNYRAYISGSVSASPNGGSDDCYGETIFTVNVPGKVLNVSKSGSGSGTVSGPGISCGSNCSEEYETGESVTLTANPSSGSTFAGWSGACSGTGSCNLSMTANRNVTATFNSNPPPGNFNIGSGGCANWPNPTIENNPNVSSGATSYSLIRRTNGGSWQTIASHWSIDAIDHYENPVSPYNTYEYRVIAHNGGGDTPSSNTRTYYINSPNCGGPSGYTLSTFIGSGSGTISGTGISCPDDCSHSISVDTWTIITASPSTGYEFSSWSGACSSSLTENCSLYMDSNKSATANFSINSYTLNVFKNGTGTVTGTGINCGSDCDHNYDYDTSVILTANPGPGQSLSSWSGACSGNNLQCTVAMTAARNVTATFSAIPFDYSLSNNGSVSVAKSSGISYGQSVVTKNLTAGATQSVDVNVSGLPSGVSASFANKTCSPTCSSTITFNVGSSAPVGTYPITVTGTPLSKQTSFNLTITGAPIAVTCSVSPNTSALLGETVTWSAVIEGGVAPLSYAWSGPAIPVSPAPSTNPFSMSYSTIGEKTAALTVTDGDGVISTCPAATVEITFDPNFEEF